MASLRDGHANRLYAAQDDVFDDTVTDLDTAAAVQAYCDKVVRSACFKRLWAEYRPPRRSVLSGLMLPSPRPPTRLVVKHFTGRGAYQYSGRNEIRVGSTRWQRYVVLHEIAHRLDPSSTHGRDFARIFLTLVRRFLPESGPALTAAYKAHRVRYRRVS